MFVYDLGESTGPKRGVRVHASACVEQGQRGVLEAREVEHETGALGEGRARSPGPHAVGRTRRRAKGAAERASDGASATLRVASLKRTVGRADDELSGCRRGDERKRRKRRAGPRARRRARRGKQRGGERGEGRERDKERARMRGKQRGEGAGEGPREKERREKERASGLEERENGPR